jgi:hypothetical protein
MTGRGAQGPWGSLGPVIGQGLGALGAFGQQAGTPGTPARRPEVRIGDSERDAAVRALGEHFAAGRLTHAEFDERSTAAWAARTESALRPLFVDLPPLTRQPTAPTAASTAGRSRARNRRFPVTPILLVVLGVLLLTGADLPVLLVVLGVWWAAVSFSRQRSCSTPHRSPGAHGAGGRHGHH